MLVQALPLALLPAGQHLVYPPQLAGHRVCTSQIHLQT